MTLGSDPLIRLGTSDTVAVARFDIAADQPLGAGSLRANQAVPRGHKVALVDMPVGEVALKYGQPIGIAYLAAAHALERDAERLLAEVVDGPPIAARASDDDRNAAGISPDQLGLGAGKFSIAILDSFGAGRVWPLGHGALAN
jgi:hypothetical protein